MEIKLGQIRSVSAAVKALADLDAELVQIHALQNQIRDKLVKLKSKKTFNFGEGYIYPYSEIILVERTHTNKGLGYEDDHDQFSEFRFYHPSVPYLIRFLSDDSIIKYEIPYKVKDYYGSPSKIQVNWGEEYREFKKKFGKVIKIDNHYTEPLNKMRFKNL